jgi:hypothetical protein
MFRTILIFDKSPIFQGFFLNEYDPKTQKINFFMKK